jgi:hypothetical protein
MKKLFLLFAILCLGFAAQAQVVSLTADTAGTLIGQAAGLTHKFTSPAITSNSQWAIELLVTPSGTHSTDSTRVQIFGSMDGTNYFQITDLGTPWLVGTAKYRGATDAAGLCGYRLSSEGHAQVGWTFMPTTTLKYRYVQVRVTQYKLLSILTVDRAKLHIFKY